MNTLPPKVRGVLSVVGGFLVHFTLGTLYTFGNINPYLTSYLRFRTSYPVSYSQSVWVFALAIFGQGTTMAFGGLIERRLGPRWTTLLGAWIMSFGVLLTSLSVKGHIVAVVITLGYIFGVGTGIAYAVAIASAMSWFPNHKGLVGGIVVAGFGGGAFVFDQVQTKYINPLNLKPNITIDNEKFFNDPDVLDRVPSCFLLIGLIYATLQLIGSMMISKPGPYDLADESRVLTRSMEKEATSPPHDSDVAEMDEEDHYEPQGLTARDLVLQFDFWILWGTFFCNSIPIVLISSLYKAFGEMFIEDDSFLAIVGSLAALCNSGGRVLWGKLMDLCSYKWLMGIQTAIMAVFLLTFNLSTQVDRSMYLIWVLILFADLSASFALFPAACSRLFGHTNLATNYGILFTGNALAGIMGALLSSTLMHLIGWMGIFIIGGVCSIISFILTMFFRGHAVRTSTT